MRIANLRVLAFVVVAASAGAACAGPDRSDLDGGPTSDAHIDVRVDTHIAPDVRDVAVDVPHDVPRDVPHDSGRVCIASCTTDLSCQTTCATPSTGISCCDTTMGHCYTEAAGVCPSTTPDSGVMMYP